MARIIVFGLIASLTLAMVLTASRFPLNHDVAWFMSIARRFVEGEQLYVDVIDPNPPLAIYLLLPAVVLTDVAGLGESTSVFLLVAAIAGVSVSWFIRLLEVRGQSIRVAWWVLLLGFATLLVPAADFGQREHLMVLLTLPFVGVAWRRTSHLQVGRREAVVAGILAGIGFAIKPFFLLGWIALELLVWSKRGRGAQRIRPEFVAVASTLVIYFILAVTIHPAYFSMMQGIAPLYRQFSTDGFRRLIVLYFALPMSIVGLATVFAREGRRERRLAMVFLTFGGAGLLAALIQGKGWRYHSLPMIVATVLAWGALVEYSISAIAGKIRGVDRSRGTFVLGLLLISAYPLYPGLAHALDLAEENRRAIVRKQQDIAPYDPRSLLVLGDVVDHAFPLVNSIDARSISPFASMWWLRAIYGIGEAPDTLPIWDRRTPTERRLSQMLVDDFLENPPDLVLVDTTEHERFGGRRFPYIAYFSQDSAFAEVWQRYEKAGAVDHFSVWRLSGSLRQDIEIE